jgi:hypothetical protein
VAISASQILAELSVLAVIFGMIFTALSFRHTLPAPSENRKKKENAVVPPQPGNKLDEKPPVVSDPALSDESAAESEPESVPDDSAGSPAEAEPAAAAEEPKAAGKNEEASEEVDIPDVITKPEAEEYDPFAPSTEPIRLTLDPLIGKTEETDSSVSGEEKG